MKVAIDAAGRLVVPRALRQELGVTSATELEIVAIDGRLELSAPDLAARVETRDGFPVFATDGGEVPVLTADAAPRSSAGAVDRARHERRDRGAQPVARGAPPCACRARGGTAVPDRSCRLGVGLGATRRRVGAGIRGGAVYDGLIGATAARHGARLVSADRRASVTYDALGLDATFV